MSNSNFCFEPLPPIPSPIRLLHILPAGDSSEIYCTVKSADLETNPSFEALSYVWGDPHVTEPIKLANAREAESGSQFVSVLQHYAKNLGIISGSLSTPSEEEFQKFHITVNLKAALQRLRKRQAIRTVWIDAICINQEDKTEKAKQIPQMGKIYSKASKVVIWLGNILEEQDHEWIDDIGEAEVLQGLELARHFSRLLPLERRDYIIGSEMDRNQYELAVRGLECIANRPWFERIWCSQEHLLARRREAYIGLESIDFDNLCQAMVSIFVFTVKNQPTRLLEVKGLSAVADMQLQKYHFQDQMSKNAPIVKRLIHLLSGHMSLKASEPRDKIYALLGLLGGHHDVPALIPDYNKPMETFYTDIARYIVLSTNSLFPLAVSAAEVLSRNLSVPSWVPLLKNNYTIEDDSLDLITSYPKVSVSGDGKRLAARVSDCFGVVKAIHLLPAAQLVVERFLMSLYDIESKLDTCSIRQRLRSLESTETKATLSQAFAEFLFQQAAQTTSPTYDDDKDRFKMLYYWYRLESSGSKASERTQKIIDMQLELVSHTVYLGVSGGKFFELSTGYFGFAAGESTDLETGDFIYGLPGARRPTTFRRSDGNFRVCSACHVYPFPVAASESEFWRLLKEKDAWIDITIE